MCYGYGAMKYPVRTFLTFLCAMFMSGGVYALEISGNTIDPGNYTVYEDVTINSGVLFEAHNIQIADTLLMHNFGEISGGVNVQSGRVLELQNAGTFNATVTKEGNARLVQVITDAADITNLGLASGYDVLVRNGTNLDLASVMQVAQNADSISVTDTTFNVGDMTGFVAPTDIALNGDIVLNFAGAPTESVLIFSNITGDNVVHVGGVGGLDVLHTLESYNVGPNLYVRTIRSTNYELIFNNDMGRFLNTLRATGVDDKLFARLDTAESFAAINDVISQSVRTNPIQLMRPIKILNVQKMLEIMHIDDATTFGIEPFLIYSSEMSLGGVRPNVIFNLSDDLHMVVSGYVLNIDYSDDINEYGGVSLGINIDGQYDVTANNFVRAHVGANMSWFDVDSVFDGMGAINNPHGASMYFGADLGHRFDFTNGIVILPFVTIGTEYFGILNTDDTNTYLGAGSDFGYKYESDGLRYGFNVRAIGRIDGNVGMGISVSLLSIIDAAGADAYMGAVYSDDFGVSCRVSLNGRFQF